MSLKGQWTRKTFSSGPKRNFFIAILSNKNVAMSRVKKWSPVRILVAPLLLKSMGNYHKLPLTSPELTHHLIRGFRRVYKQRGLYPRGLKTEIENALYNKL